MLTMTDLGDTRRTRTLVEVQTMTRISRHVAGMIAVGVVTVTIEALRVNAP